LRPDPREALSRASDQELVQEKKVDTTFLITHRSTDLAEGPDLYKTFKTKKDGCVKVVFHPA
jgi:threonine dehydrogenase-like Zn-dependent dehydrogenase